MNQERRAAERGDNQNGNTDFRHAEQAPSSRDEGPMWLYDDPYEPYVPRSIFRKKAPQPAAAPTPAEPPVAPEVSSGVETVTVAEVNAVLDKWANVILGVLRDFPDALRAVQDALRAFQKPLLAT